MASSNVTVTTADKHIPDIWVDGLLRAQEFDMKWAPRVDRSWGKDYKFGDIFRKQRLPNIEVQTKSAGSGLTANAYTDTEQTITVNVHQACAQKVEEIVDVLNKNNLSMEMQKKMGYALSRAVDVNLSALVASFSQNVGTLGVELTFDNLLRAVQYIEDTGYNMGDCSWIFCPAQKLALHKMDTFVNSLYVGSAAAESAHNGRVGNFMGAEIVMSQLTTSDGAGHDNALFDSSAIALIMAQAPKVQTQFIGLDLANVIVSSQIYGYGEVDRYSETPANITATDENAVWLKGV